MFKIRLGYSILLALYSTAALTAPFPPGSTGSTTNLTDSSYTSGSIGTLTGTQLVNRYTANVATTITQNGGYWNIPSNGFNWMVTNNSSPNTVNLNLSNVSIDIGHSVLLSGTTGNVNLSLSGTGSYRRNQATGAAIATFRSTGSGNFTLSSGGSVSIESTIGGTSQTAPVIAHTGSGTFTLNHGSSNGIAGTISASAGDLQINHSGDGALSTSSISQSNASKTLTYINSGGGNVFTFASPATISSTGNLNIQLNGSGGISPAIGSLTVSAAQNFSLAYNGSGRITGTISPTSGKINIFTLGSGQSASIPSVNFNNLIVGGTMSTAGDLASMNGTSAGSSAAINVASTGTLNVNNNITGTGSIISSGQITISVGQTVSMQNITINAGAIGGGGAIDNNTHSFTLNGGSYSVSNFTNTNGFLYVNGGTFTAPTTFTSTTNGRVYVNGSGTISGSLDRVGNSGSFMYIGGSSPITTNFSLPFTTGFTTVQIDNVNSSNNVNNGGNTITGITDFTINSGGRFSIASGSVTATNFTNSGTLTLSGTNGFIVTNFTQSSGTTNVSANNNLATTASTISGGTFNISSGTLTNPLGATATVTGSPTFSGAGTLANAGTLNFNSSSITLQSAVSNTGTWNIQQTLTGVTGTITNTGSIAITSGRTFSTSGTLQNNSGGTISGAGATLTIASGGNFIYNNSSSASSLTTSTLNLYSTLNVNQDMNLPGTTNVQTTGSIIIATGKTLSVNSGATFNYYSTVSSGMSGAGNFTNNGSILYSSSVVNGWQFSGTFTNSATGSIGVGSNMYTNPGNIINNNIIYVGVGYTLTNIGTFTANNGSSLANADSSFINNSTFTVANAATTSIGPQTTNNSTFTVNSGAVLSVGLFRNNSTVNISGTMSVANTYNSVINSGTFNVLSGGTLTTNIAGTSVTNNASATMNIAGTLTIDPNPPGPGTFSISNSGTFNLTGTYGATGGTFTNNSNGTINSSGSFAGSSTVSNSGTLNVTAGTFTGSGAFTNSGTITLSGGSFTKPITFTNTGTTNLNGGTITGEYTGGTGSILNVNSSFTTLGTYDGLQTLNVNGSTFTLGTNFDFTNGNVVNINSGATMVLSSASLLSANASGSTKAINVNGGTLTVNSGADSPNFTNFTAINVASNGTINIAANPFVITDTNILGASGNTGSSLNITGNLSTNSAITDISSIFLDSGTLTLRSGATVSGFDTFTDNGTLTLESGAFFTVNPSDNFTGTGSIDNTGTLTIAGGNLTLGGDFVNNPGGSLIIQGTPTLTFNGTTFTNKGTIQAVFNSSGSIAKINALNETAPDLADGVIVIGYQNTYLAEKTYPFMEFGGVPTIGVAFLPQPTRYITSWDLVADGNILGIAVTRKGFNEYVTDPSAQLIGSYLEQIGAGSPTQQQLDLLNSLELIDNNEDLTVALLALLPPQNIQLQNIAIQDSMLGAVEIRLYRCRFNDRFCGTNYGDDFNDNSMWIRPFATAGTQRNVGNLLGYTANTNGVIFGLDKQISPYVLLGVAGSYASSNVVQTYNELTRTRIHTYQGILYSTVRNDSGGYLDAMFAAGVNNYVGDRVIDFSSYTQTAYSKYQTQQVTAKVMASQNYAFGMFQVTPQGNAQYSYIRQLTYTETGAGNFNLIIDPDNINLFRLGAGIKVGLPMSDRNMLSIPSVHFNCFVDVAGGASVIQQQFITGGPIITNSVAAGKVLYQLGANYEFSISDRIQLMVEYDVDIRNGFTGQEGYVNIKYIF